MCVDTMTELISYAMLAVLATMSVVSMFKISSLSRQLRLQQGQSPPQEMPSTTVGPDQTDVHSHSAN